MKSDNDVVITGVGIVTSLGVGIEPHVAFLTGSSIDEPKVETERFKPYPVHPMPEIDWSAQIAKRGDQRQKRKDIEETLLELDNVEEAST